MKKIFLAFVVLFVTIFITSCDFASNVNVNFYDGNTILETQTVKKGEKVNKPTDPIKTGYVFVNWYKDQAFSGDPYNFDDTVEKGFNLYAKWENPNEVEPTPTTYVVTFNTNGGTSIESQEVESGELISNVTTTKSGYTFVGWYKDQALTEVFNVSSDTITSNITLYAKWQANPTQEVTPTKYTVTFNTDGGSSVSSQSIEKGKTATKPSNPTKSGYTFVGWFEGNEDTTEFSFSTAIYENITLYARWQKNESETGEATVEGYNEGLYALWEDDEATKSSVMYKLSTDSSWTTCDEELIRQYTDYGRVDIVGIKAGEYDIKIITSSNSTIIKNNISVGEYDRSGYAHFGTTNGVGAYNNDGTLKSNAIVVYVTNETKNTVKLTYNGSTYTGLVKIIQASKSLNAPLVIRVIGSIKTNQWNSKVTEARLADDSNFDDTYFDNTLETKYGDNLANLTVQYMDKKEGIAYKYLTTASGLGTVTKGETSKGTTTINKVLYYDDDSYFNMLDVTDASNVTLEGIGTDAEFLQFGLTWKKCSSIEVRNITFTDYPEDGCSFEGSGDTKDSLDSYRRYWVHNNEFNSGKNNWDLTAERDKPLGDGANDYKRVSNITSSYNKFDTCKKTGLVGGSNSNLTGNVTFHHNYYYNVNSRLPLGRQANMHFYNNYYYGCGTCQDIRANAFVLSEANYFDICNKGQLVTTDDEYTGTVIKSYGDVLNGATTQATVVSSRTQTLTGNCKPDGVTDYTNFDTNSTLFYYDSTNKVSDVRYLTSAAQAKEDCIKYSGVLANGKGFIGLEQEEVVTYTVTFNTNGGSSISSQTVVAGNKISSVTTTKSGYVFKGWYTDSSLTVAFNVSTAITKNITLYAKWQEASQSSSYSLDVSDYTKNTVIAAGSQETIGDFTIKGEITIKTGTNEATDGTKFTNYVSFGGKGDISNKNIAITLSAGSYTITSYALSSGDSSRTLNIYDGENVIGTLSAAEKTASLQSSTTNITLTEDTVIYIYSSGSGINVWGLIIE